MWNTDLSAPGPGLMLQRLQRGGPEVEAAVAVIVALNADVLVLGGLDHDLRGEGLAALEAQLGRPGAPYPYRMALRPNSGVPTGLDLDGNGKRGEPRDAQGYGRFAGEGAMAVLSRLPLGEAVDYSAFLWADLPGNLMPLAPPEVRAVQRLSSGGHWSVPVQLPDGGTLTLLTFYASPPVFDGPEDRNGRRNHDEVAFWLRLLAGELPFAAPQAPFVLLGQTNLDPADGEGRREAVTALLNQPALQDPAPRGNAPRSDPGQSGDPALDTALYPGLGGLRVEVILPSAGLAVTGAAVVWPPPDDPLTPALEAASRHRPLWVNLAP
ncbi:endonuclease/exonuclease/phosphatase family protein [Paracoccaceae bacterium]